MKNPLVFLSEVRQELHKVQWPTWPQTLRYTLLVIAISVAMAVYLGVLDSLFGRILSNFF